MDCCLDGVGMKYLTILVVQDKTYDANNKQLMGKALGRDGNWHVMETGIDFKKERIFFLCFSEKKNMVHKQEIWLA